MASSARLVTIKRSGDDGAHFPLILSSCLFGRSIECDIRIQLPVVSKKHCKIEVNKQQAILYNFSSTNPTQVNGAAIDEPVQLKNGDIITIIDRSFRYENGSHEDGSRSTGFPGKSSGQEPAQRAWRASFSADSDGKGQDTKASKTTTSRRSLVHAKRLPGDSSTSDYSKDSIIQDPLATCSSEPIEQHSSRNIGEPTSGDLIKKSRATESSYRELKSPALSLCNSKKNESPFKKLYQSMKEELDVKSQKQSRRKSEPQPECVAGKDTRETKLLVACKSRPKSSGSTPGTAASSPRVEKMGTEKRSRDVGPVETSTEALSSGFSLSETAKVKTPVRSSQPLKNEAVLVTGKRESVNLNENEGAKAVHKIVTPRKLGTRKQAAVTVEDAASPGDTPESLSSKKRKSSPAQVDVLPAEKQKRFPSTQPLTPGEKKTPKDSVSKPEKLATAAEQICSGLPGLSSVDISNFDKSEGMSLKRRRVSFGGHLRPELFDENLPPNTPLKRGETPTKRKSFTTHSPAVLKKIIKEWRQSPGKQESPGITPPRANDQRCRSGRNSSDSSGSSPLHQTDMAKKAGRKSGNLPAKRASISRSQHDILQMICSKRRSGASEANLIVAKSWADVVKLGTKQIQTKVVKHVPQKQTSKRQRRPSTPKKPTSDLHNQFSTGHANSPSTIVIGRAQIEKVSMPARPYKMLNNLMLNRKMDFSEDLSGLTEMFKTPGKEKQQQMDDMDFILSNSENLPEKQFQVTKSGDKPPPITSEIWGEDVLSSTQNAAKEPSDIYSASPTLRRKSIKNGNTVQTPKNIHNFSHLEKKTSGSVTEPQKTVSSVSKLKRSRELIHTLIESVNENTEADRAESIKGRHLRKTSLEGQEVDEEKPSAMRSNAKEQKPTKDLIGIQMVTQTTAYAEELLNQNQEKGTTEKPEGSMHKQNTPIGDGHRATKQKVDQVCASQVKHWPRTPDQKAQLLEGPVGLKEPFETPNCRDNLTGADKSKVPYKSPQPTTEKMRTSTKAWPGLSGKKVDLKKEDSAGKKFVRMSGGARPTPKVSELEHGAIKALKESENQMLDLTVTGSKRPERKTKEKTQPLDDLAGFQELFLSPVPGDKITKMLNKSLCSEKIRSPASTKRLSKTVLDKVDVKEIHSALGKRTKSPGRGTRTPTASVLEEHDTTAFMETPKQKLDFTENSTGHTRRSRTPKIRAQPLEDLDGFQELFQTPVGTSDPVIVGETTNVSLDCPQPEPVRGPTSTKRLSKTGLDKVDVKEVHSALGKRTKSPGRGTRTPTASVLEEHDTTAFMETPKQKLDFTENSTGRTRRSRTPKIRAQPLEDLDGFQELFQTPVGSSDPVIVGETTNVSLECPQPEPVRGLASTKRLSKTGLDKVDVKEIHSALGKRTKSPGRGTRTPTASVLEEHDTTAFMETPKQKLDFIENSTGRTRRSRTPKIRAQPLEDLDGFQELFQTPVGTSDPVIVGETTNVSLECPQSEPVRGPASTKRLSKTGLDKVDVKEIHSALGKQTKSPGRGTRTPTASVLEEHDTTAFMETPKQKLDFTENSTGRTRRSRTPKIRAQPLEDLDGFQELFQTPVGTSDPVIVGETTNVSLDCPQPEPVRGPASTKRLSKKGLDKVDVKEVHSTLGKRTKSPGRGTRTPTASVLEEHDTTAFMETPKQKLDFTENSIGRTRRSRTPKIRAQPLEDLNDFQELFQTPVGTSDPVTVGETTNVTLECPQPEPVRGPASTKRLSKTGLDKVDVKEVHSALGKRTKSPGRAALTTTVKQEKGIKPIMETSNQKLESVGNLTGPKKQPRIPNEESRSLEDLTDFPELLQAPDHGNDPLAVDKTKKMSFNSLQPEPVITLKSIKRQSRASMGKTEDKEELSKTEKHPQIEKAIDILQVSNDNNGIRPSKQATKRKLDPAASMPSSKRLRRTSRANTPGLEDLSSFQQLFQTPDHAKDSVTIGETLKIPTKSPQSGPVKSQTSRKSLPKITLRRMDVPEELSTLWKQSPGKASTVPGQQDNGIQAITKKLETTANVTGLIQQQRASKEDLNGFQELFQTPGCSTDPLIGNKRKGMSSKSPRTGLIRTSQTSKRLAKTSLGNVGVKEEISLLNVPSCVKGEIMHIPRLLDDDVRGNKDLKDSITQTLGPSVSVTNKKQRRARKERSQSPEGLFGLQELFQTPASHKDSMTVCHTTKMSLESSEPEHFRSLASTKRLSKKGLDKVDEKEVHSALGKRTKSPGRGTRTPTASVLEEHDTTAFMETPKQKLDFTENSTGRTRRSRTPKIRAQPLEDLDGFQELFQTPVGTSDPVTVGETTNVSLERPQPEPVRGPASTKRLSKTGLSTEKGTKSPGRVSGTPIASVQKDNGSTAFMETPKQKLHFTKSLTGYKRRSQTPKIKAQPLEDLDGFQELFQTPVGANVPMTVEETTKVSLECLQPEPVITPASTKRLSKTGLDKVDMREKLSPLNKLRCSSQEVGPVPRLTDDGRGTKDLKEFSAQTSDPAVRVTGKKRKQGACKKSSLSSEDLFGLQELFQTPGRDKDSVAGDKLTKMPHKSPPPEPVDASRTSQRQSRTRLMKIHVKNELSGDRTLPKMSEEIMDITNIAEGEDKGIRTRKRPVKRKLDTAVSVSSSKRQRVAITEKAQTLMDPPGFKELYQTASLAVDLVTVDKTTKMPSKSPEPMDTISETRPGRRLRKVGVTEEPVAQRKTTRVLRETRNTHKDPMGDSKGVKDLKESSVQKQDLAVSLTGKRNQPRTLKTQPLEELPSIQEETATRISCESQHLEEKESSTASKRQLRTQLCKVGVKEEPTAQRKPPSRKTRNTLKEPLSDSGSGEELKESTKQQIDPAAGVLVSKRPRRVPREKAQSLELASLKEPVQIPGHTEKSASNKTSTEMPCNSLQPQHVDSLQTSPRRLRTRRGKVEVDKEPSVVRKTVPTSRQTTRSCKVDKIDDKDTQASKEPAKQKLETVASETGSRRQLRVPKDKVQPLEVLGDSKKLAEISEHTEKLGHDTSSLKSILQQMPDSTKPPRTCKRVLRASKEDTMEMPVNIIDPVESQSKSNTLMAPKRKSARDVSISRTRELRSMTTKQDETDEKPAPTKQRAAPSKRHVSPEPLKTKYLRIVSSKIDPVEEQISNIMKTEEKEAQVENSAPPDQKICLPSRYQKNTNGRQPRPGAFAETAHIKKNEETMKTSQETELQNTDDRAKKSTSRAKVSGKRTCLRSRGQSEVPQPHAAEEKTSEAGAEILIKTRKKEISGGSEARCLRSRKARATLDSEPQPRVTRGAKKDTKVPKKDEDIVYTTKLRTRSHQNSKNM